MVVARRIIFIKKTFLYKSDKVNAYASAYGVTV